MEEGRQYWQGQAKGFPWRTEPEIDAKRQEELSKCRAIVPDITKGIFPFKGMKLSRADVEWLLATHENERGPVLWDEEKDKPERERRTGLDLRGADLSGGDLRDLPLSRLLGGQDPLELFGGQDLRESGLPWASVLEIEQAWYEGRLTAGIFLKDAMLWGAHLEGANLARAYLERADLAGADLEGANLVEAHLERANLMEADLEGAKLIKAYLDGSCLVGARLEGADMSEANLKVVVLRNADLKNADLVRAHLEGADLTEAHLEGANLSRAANHLAEHQPRRDQRPKKAINAAILESRVH